MKQVKTRARVQLTIEFEVGDAWGGDCGLAQVWEQGSRAALGMLDKKLSGAISAGLIQIISGPKVTAILAEGE